MASDGENPRPFPVRKGQARRGAAGKAVPEAADALETRRGDATRSLKRALVRLERRVAAIRADLARIAEAQVLADQARWLVPEAARAPRGARALSFTDWSSGEPRTVEIPLDPAKPAKVQIDAIFQRARRLKLGGATAQARLDEAQATIAALAPLASRAADAESMEELEEVLAAAHAAAPKDLRLPGAATTPGKRAPLQPRALPYRTFRSRSGMKILVGRGAAHNDELTFHVARPRDLWLHAKGLPGAHVIVPLQKDRTCPGDLLVDAAHLAAHFSDARDEAVADVTYASRRHVRKPRGSPPGLVAVDREKVIAVRIEPALKAQLLASEES
jgi:predicted ribosome quality control (RQC) complex YloA/Tae2 family protein